MMTVLLSKTLFLSSHVSDQQLLPHESGCRADALGYRVHCLFLAIQTGPYQKTRLLRKNSTDDC